MPDKKPMSPMYVFVLILCTAIFGVGVQAAMGLTPMDEFQPWHFVPVVVICAICASYISWLSRRHG